jgi:hypothetical protein
LRERGRLARIIYYLEKMLFLKTRHFAPNAYFPHMTTQFLTDDRGQKVAVVIPIADYESLMEDVADLAAVAERRDDDRISLKQLKEQLTADGLLPR